jgi:hypothetical protein
MRPSYRPRLEALEDRCTPSTLTVTNFLDGGKGSLRYEIAAARSGDTIVFDKKIDRGGTIALTSGNELYIDKNLTIQGPGAGLLTVYGGNEFGAQRIFEVGPGAAVALSGLTIDHGGGHASASGIPDGQLYDGDGGGVLNRGTLTIGGCTLSNNSADSGPDSATSGGAIYNAGVLTVNGCTLVNNHANLGGGIYNLGTATVTGGSVSNNDARAGGGIFNFGTMTISGCGVSSNSANGTSGVSAEGGGIYNTGTATVSGCTLSGNSAAFGFGGCIYNAGTAAALTVSTSTFSFNTPDNIFGPYTDGGGNTFI